MLFDDSTKVHTYATRTDSKNGINLTIIIGFRNSFSRIRQLWRPSNEKEKIIKQDEIKETEDSGD